MRIENLELQTDIYKILDALFEDLHKKNSNLFKMGYRESGDYLMVQCPYHKDGQERKPSGEFKKDDGWFYCFNCKQSHRLTSVIYDTLGVNGKSWLLSHFDGSNIEDRQVTFNIGRKKPEPKVYVNNNVLDQYRTKHPYMYTRKLTDEIIDKFDIGYDPDFILDIKDAKGNIIGHKKVGGCITFPNRDANGNLLFIARRSVNTKFFHYPYGADKPIYGLYELNREIASGKNIQEVYICESMINCLTLWSWGKYALALNGTGSKQQIEQLKKLEIRHLILALDPDDAGRHGTEKIIKNIRNKFISIVNMPDGKDVNDLTQDEFNNLSIINSFNYRPGYTKHKK